METITAKAKVTIEFSIQLNLTEEEAEALYGIAGYGADAFLEVFYPKMGKAYLEPYEMGLRLLFKTIQNTMPNEISKIKGAKENLSKELSKFK